MSAVTAAVMADMGATAGIFGKPCNEVKGLRHLKSVFHAPLTCSKVARKKGMLPYTALS